MGVVSKVSKYCCFAAVVSKRGETDRGCYRGQERSRADASARL